ncbi:MAG: recombinase family protein, partial [Gammaproteobacteria bacterium]
MSTESSQKVTAAHLKRDAFLYIRQSSLRQVMENTESTQRQYALRERAVALGWPIEGIHVIDSDRGRSGAQALDRDGFQRLVSEVAMGHAGIVLGLEVSRLARNNADWHRLLELSALAGTLILDEDGLYDPRHFNDRLLLGLKGAMSEAELHVLKARLQGGIRNKARRGELEMPLPIGLTYGPNGTVVLDPDQQIQSALRWLFETFKQTGSAMAVVRRFRREKLLFPRRVRRGIGKGDLHWAALDHSRVLQILHNPRYAGAFVYGRTRSARTAELRPTTLKVAREDWQVLIPNVHPGYLSWEEFEGNQIRLRDNAAGFSANSRGNVPREGPALLQGRLLCGRCGARMRVRYDCVDHRLEPYYVCSDAVVRHAGTLCQSVRGTSIDVAISVLLLETVAPAAIEVALAVQGEIAERIRQADALRHQQLERARYDAELARRRYLKVDPDNRLVADALEADWNDQLRRLDHLQQELEHQRQTDNRVLTEEARGRILELVKDFPRVWNDPKTPALERKRMVALLIEDVTLIKADVVTLHVRFRGGRTHSFSVPRPVPIARIRKTLPEVVQ